MKPISLIVALMMMLPMTATAASATPESFYRQGNLRILGNSPPYLDLGAGIFDWKDDTSGAARVELRFGRKLFFLGPALGLIANTDGGFFAYGGLYADIVYKRLALTPFWAVGGYEKGDGKDLGGTFEFRSALTLSYQFDNLSRLGVQIAHISNANLHDSNPGEQDAFLTFAFPF